MKKFSKKTIATVLAGTTVAATGVLLGVGLTNWTDNQDDYIAFHFGDQELVLDSQDIEQLEGYATSITELKTVSTLEEEPPADDPAEEPPEGEEPPAEEEPSEEPNDEEDTNKEIAANWIETGFYYISLTGTLPNIDTGRVEDITEGSILGSTEYQNEFIIIDTADDFNAVYTELVEIALFRNTSGAGKYVYQYMIELAEQHPYLLPYVSPFTDTQFKTVWDMKEAAANDQYWADAYNNLIEQLRYAMNIESDVVTSLYVYTYLYQEHTSSAFDYYMTEQLVNQKPMIMWELSVNGLNATNQDEMDVLLGTDGYLDWSQMTYWQDKIENDHNYSVTDIFMTDADGNQGFMGITSATATSVNIEGFTDYNNFQVFYEGDETEINKIVNGDIGKINVSQDESDGSVIVADQDPKTGKVVLYVPLYPFSFAHNYQDDLYDTADFYSYSLTAYDVNNSVDPELNPSGVYTYEGTEEQKVTYFELVDLALQSNPALSALFENQWVSTIDAFSLWLFDFVYRINMDSLTISAQQYWRNEGYYIELSGQYEEDYAQLLPLWIQK